MSFFDLLKTVPMFSSPSDRELTVIEALQWVETFRRDEVIIKQEETGRSLDVVIEGTVSITKSTPEAHKIRLAEVLRGEVLGELSALDAGPRLADGTAMQDCKLLALQRDKFLLFVQNEP